MKTTAATTQNPAKTAPAARPAKSPKNPAGAIKKPHSTAILTGKNPSYAPRALKRRRRTKTQMRALKDRIKETLSKDFPATVRGLFYRCVAAGIIEKSEASYKQIVVRMVTQMREDGEIPWSRIVDVSRWRRKPRTFDGIHALLNDAQTMYRRDIWRDQDDYLELWCEKDAVAALLYRETSPWDVPLMSARGYASASFLHAAGIAIRAQRKPCFIAYIGDFDPSGVDAARYVEEKLKHHSGRDDITFERIAVTPRQIEEWHLPTRPTKKSDSRAKGFAEASVDCDAIPTGKLRQLVRSFIEGHIDQRKLRETKRIEALEKETLSEFTDDYDLEYDDDE